MEVSNTEAGRAGGAIPGGAGRGEGKHELSYFPSAARWGGGRGSWDEVREWHGHIYTTKCEIDG